MERPRFEPEIKNLLKGWPEELPTKVLFRALDAEGAPEGEGFLIVVTDTGIDLSQLPPAARDNFRVGGLPDELGNRVRPESKPKEFMTALLRQSSRRWHIEIVL